MTSSLSHRRLRTAALLTAAGLLALAPASTASAASAAAAPTTGTVDVAMVVKPAAPARARWAAGWLGRQMVDGSHFEVVFDGIPYNDAGLTLDAVLAFAAAKVGDANAERALNWLEVGELLGGYIGDGDGESYAGAHAKLALALSVRGQDPTLFGGRDILAELTALRAPSGRFSDRSAFGDFSNAFSQSLAVIALDRAGQSTWTASGYLAGQACPGGGIPQNFDAEVCTPSVDATAIAVQAFLAGDRRSVAARAVGWLRSQQGPDGGFGNANSTALAAAAFATAGRAVYAAQARGALSATQQDCTAPEADRGAVGYQVGPFDPASAPRASAQAVLGFASANLATLTAEGSVDVLPTRPCPVLP